MELNLITVDDLNRFKAELLSDIKKIMQGNTPHTWLRSQDVQDLLNISPSTLHNLRERKVIPHSKICGVILYEYDDIIELLRKNKIK